jgi:chromosome segregation ATPase
MPACCAACRCQLTAAKADAHIQQQRLAAAEGTAATTAAQLLEAQANLSKARAEAATLQHDAESKLAAAKLACNGCAEKAGKLLQVEQQLQDTKAMLSDEQQQRHALQSGVEVCRGELQGVKAALAAAQHAKEQLYFQLHGVSNPDAFAGDPAGEVVQYNMAGSPVRMQLQWGPAEEGLIQRCSNMTVQLEQQDKELSNLRQQLLEQQLALSEAQTSCSSAERQLLQAATELKAAHAAAAEASAAATAAKQEASTAQQQVQQLRQTVGQTQPDLAACKAQVQKLEAQQKVLLGEVMLVWMVAIDLQSREMCRVCKVKLR